MERTVFLSRITQYFRSHRIVGILGSRQCGKTTLARDHIATLGNEAFAGGDHGAGGQVHYFDLEDPEHLSRLTDPKLALESLEGLIVIDEIQRLPELFPLLRVLIDRNRPKQRYLILGSASRDLIRQSSETLAGRIIYLELPPFTAFEADDHNHLWLRGGYPPAYLAGTDSDSIIWRKAYVTTLLERDLPALGIDFAQPRIQLARLRPSPASPLSPLGMVAMARQHPRVGIRAFAVSSPTIRRYLDILDGTFVTRTLQPWYENIRKRQVKSPKILATAASCTRCSTCRMRTACALIPSSALRGRGSRWSRSSRCTGPRPANASSGPHGDAELDLLIVQGTKKTAYEFKYTSTPRVTRSMHSALGDLNLDRITIVCPGDGAYPLAENVRVAGLKTLVQESHDVA